MSGGSHNYIYSKLSVECEGEMHDAEMNDLIKDLCDVLHDLEWWQSGDYSEEQYRETVSEFKKKWFKELISKEDEEMGFQMKNKYETGEEFYQDIKKHLIEDGFVITKSDETLAILSDEEDEWYCHYQICSTCNTDFMCSKAKFCPGCGRKIVGSKRGNETVFYGKGDEDEKR